MPAASAEDLDLSMVVVDGVRLFLQGIVSLLSSRPGIRVVATAADADETVLAAREHHPELVLLGSHLAPAECFAVTRQLARTLPVVKVIILSPAPDRHFLGEAARAGAAGVVYDTVDNRELVQIIWAVRRGQALVSPQFVPLPNGGGRGRSRRSVNRLGVTEQELRVLVRLVEGCSNSEIARSLAISLDTVKSHLKHLFGKLGVRTRTEAAVVGLRWGLLEDRLSPEAGELPGKRNARNGARGSNRTRAPGS